MHSIWEVFAYPHRWGEVTLLLPYQRAVIGQMSISAARVQVYQSKDPVFIFKFIIVSLATIIVRFT